MMSTIGQLNSFALFQLADGSYANVYIIDTAGQEKYRALPDKLYKQADGILLVYDITNIRSLDEVRNYYSAQIKDVCKKGITVILLGNKTDLEEEREIPPEVGKCIADEKGYMFMESSCLKNENVSGCFETLIELTYREVTQNKRDKGIALEKTKKNKKNKKGQRINDCC